MAKNIILIIDDDKVTTAVIEEYLTNYGFVVKVSQDGDTGIGIMKETDPDLIILDIMMPGKDGMQILKEIKLTSGFTNTPVILLSSVDRTNIKVKGLELGADDYITKPVDMAELLARIQLSLKRSSKSRDNKNILEGSLSDFTLTDLLQSFELGKKTSTISFPDMDAEITIKNGLIISCRQGTFTKAKAINRIFFLEKGKFIVNFDDVKNSKGNEKIRILSLIMSNIAYIDEVRLIVNSLPENLKKVRVTQEFNDLIGVNITGSDDPKSIDDIIVGMKGNLKENVEALIQINKDFPHLFNGKQ